MKITKNFVKQFGIRGFAVCLVFVFVLGLMCIDADAASKSKKKTKVTKQKYATIFDAIDNGTAQDVQQFIKNGARLNTRDKNNRLPLIYALDKDRHISIVKALIDGGANVNINTGNYLATPLMEAADNTFQKNALDAIKLLLKSGADVNARNDDGETALTIAASNSLTSLNAIRALLQAGADVNAKNNHGTTALMRVCGDNDPLPEVVQELIRAGADVNAKDNEGYSALLYNLTFEYSEDSEIIRALVEAGADINIRDNSFQLPLHLASKPESIEVLEKAKAKYEAENGRKKSYANLLEAVEMGTVDEIKKLIKAGAKVNEKLYGTTPLIWAIGHCKSGRLAEIVDLLLEAGANVNVKTDYNWTALMHAVSSSSPDALKVVQVLLKTGANVNIGSENNYTPLLLAAGSRSPDAPQIVQALLNAGADVNAQTTDYEYTPLMWAIVDNSSETVIPIVKILLKAGANPNVKDTYGDGILSKITDNPFATELNKILKETRNW